jgi:hypothetical protein
MYTALVKRIPGCNATVVDRTPTQHQLLAAHERRARIIAQLQAQAGATADGGSAQTRDLHTRKSPQPSYRRTVAWLIVAGTFVWGLGCILVLSYLMIKAL